MITIAFDYASLQAFKMTTSIDSPADSEIRSVIRFLSAKAIDIHDEICAIYDIMSDGMVRKWVRA